MKATRIIAIVLAVFMAFTLASCAKTDSVAASSSAAEETKAAAETAEATQAEATEAATQAASESPAATQAAKGDGDQKFVGISFPSTLVDRWPKEAELLKSGLEALGYKAEIQYADEDANKQFQQCDNFISQGVDLLVVCAVDTVSAAQIVETAHNEKVPVFSYCRIIENCTPDAFVAEDNDKVGTLQGQYIVDNVEKGNIIIVGGAATDSNGVLYRKKGVEALQAKIDDGSYTVVADQYCDSWDPAVAMANVENALTKCNNNVAAILCPNDGLAGGAIEALAAQGLAGKVIVTGGDGELAAAKRIMAGTQSMTVFKDSKLIAGTAVKAIDAYLSGSTPEYNGVVNNGTADINAVLVDMTVVTKDNMQKVFIDGGVFSEADLNSKD